MATHLAASAAKSDDNKWVTPKLRVYAQPNHICYLQNENTAASLSVHFCILMNIILLPWQRIPQHQQQCHMNSINVTLCWVSIHKYITFTSCIIKALTPSIQPVLPIMPQLIVHKIGEFWKFTKIKIGEFWKFTSNYTGNYGKMAFSKKLINVHLNSPQG